MSTITLVPVDLIDPHPRNPRRDLGDLAELADSIRAQGIRQNLLLVPSRDCGHTAFDAVEDKDVEDDLWWCPTCGVPIRFSVVIGHRRLSAARLAGLANVPAVIDAGLGDAAQIELMLLENIQRTDLSPVEEAQGYQDLLDLGLKVSQIAEATGRSRNTVAARLRLQKLPGAAREKVHTGQATLEQAAELDQLVDGTVNVDAKQLAKVVEALGTHNFEWELQQAKTTARRRAEAAALVARFAELGVDDCAGNPQISDGYEYIAYAPEVDCIPDDLPAGCVYKMNHGCASLYRPLSADERAALADTKDEDRGSAREHDERLTQEGFAAYQLRDAWIRQYMTRKKVPAAHHLAIVEVAAPFAIAGWHPMETVGNLDTWLGLPKPNQWRSREDRYQQLRELHPDVPPAMWLLAWLHLACTVRTFHQAWQHPAAPALYSLLEQIGYQASDAELARLTPPAEGEES